MTKEELSSLKNVINEVENNLVLMLEQYKDVLRNCNPCEIHNGYIGACKFCGREQDPLHGGHHSTCIYKKLTAQN
jgi:hypothetical protein